MIIDEIFHESAKLGQGCSNISGCLSRPILLLGSIFLIVASNNYFPNYYYIISTYIIILVFWLALYMKT